MNMLHVGYTPGKPRLSMNMVQLDRRREKRDGHIRVAQRRFGTMKILSAEKRAQTQLAATPSNNAESIHIRGRDTANLDGPRLN